MKPATPPAGRDTILPGQWKTIEQFFAARRNNTVCRKTLSDQTKAYGEQRAKLRKAVEEKRAPKEIEALETEAERLRDIMLETTELCGDCATNPVTSIDAFEEEGRTQYWSVSDGSCYLPQSTDEDYAVRAESLLDIAGYPQSAGGFSDVLTFKGFDVATKEWNDATTFTTPTSHAYVAVRSFVKKGIFRKGLEYWFKNTAHDFDPLKSFLVSFESLDRTKNWPVASAYETRQSGEKRYFECHPLEEVAGFWYLEKNYLRYFTKADFGSLTGTPLDSLLTPKTGFIQKGARRMLLNTILQLAERTATETNPVLLGGGR